MSLKPRFVFDTNTIVSAFLFDESIPQKALQEALAHGEVLLSTKVLEELAEVLRRSKFDRYVSRKTREQFLRALIQVAVLIEITETFHACRDAKDDKFLELAVSGNASHLISGDEDLLVLNPFRGVSIVTPRQFLEHMARSK